jgi:predicted nucleic acid-binding protein
VVRSVYFDTNVYVAATEVGPLRASSDRVVELARTGRVAGVGSALVRRELRAVCERTGSLQPLNLYWPAVVVEFGGGKQDAWLTKVYRHALRIKVADAHHLAFATSGRVDVFASWNRNDLVKASTLRVVKEINESLGFRTPLILTPAQFEARTTRVGGRGGVVLD